MVVFTDDLANCATNADLSSDLVDFPGSFYSTVPRHQNISLFAGKSDELQPEAV